MDFLLDFADLRGKARQTPRIRLLAELTRVQAVAPSAPKGAVEITARVAIPADNMRRVLVFSAQLLAREVYPLADWLATAIDSEFTRFTSGASGSRELPPGAPADLVVSRAYPWFALETKSYRRRQSDVDDGH